MKRSHISSSHISNGHISNSIAAALATALAAGSAPAQQSDRWITERAALNSSGHVEAVAVVAAVNGDALRVYQDARGTLHLSLRLRNGLERLSTSLCPTVQVDDDAPITQIPGQLCATDPRGARLTLGEIEDGTIKSPLLLRLMNGTTITARFKLNAWGYRSSVFTLTGSKQALFNVIGPDVITDGI
ncbi:MAG: hypothetical protein GKR94_32920 [Gammaproteobacteria bacterium]|nr:hypothetical protein [Gammaproteobacteria bacterium]